MVLGLVLTPPRTSVKVGTELSIHPFISVMGHGNAGNRVYIA
jgi:hypothetical protein